MKLLFDKIQSEDLRNHEQSERDIKCLFIPGLEAQSAILSPAKTKKNNTKTRLLR